MNDVFEEFLWTVRSYECAADGRVTVANVCNYLQEAASLNAEHLGFSKVNFDAAGGNITWVMTRMRLTLSRRPKWGETVKTLTFPRPARRIVAWRDFIIYGGAGEEIGRASTEWMVIDMTTRRPVSIPAFVNDSGNTVREPVFKAPLGFKLAAEAFAGAEKYVLRSAPSDIDLNKHVNNVRYITWLFDALGDQPRDGIEMELAFKSETRAGETVVVETVRCETGILQRLTDGNGADHVLCRMTIARP